jgi:ribosome biogenesis protein UTP30
LSCALVSLSPSTNTSVRIGYAGWSPEKVAENIETVANEVITKFVPQKWKNIRAIHIKGPETASLPIWLAEELWTNDNDVLAEAVEETKAITSGETPNIGKKRKALEPAHEEPKVGKKAKKVKAPELPQGNDKNLDKEISLRKERLKKQKEEAAASVEDDIPKAKSKTMTKKAKNGKVLPVET